MVSLQKNGNLVFLWIKKNISLDKSALSDYSEEGKEDALCAVAILQNYKSNVHDFTDDIVNFWSLPERVMARYHFNDVDELNEWLDNMSH